MKFSIKERKYVIMNKQRTVIAKGTPRNRHLIPIHESKDKKRILYYTSENMARSAFTSCGFYGNHDPNNNGQPYDLEPVAVDLIMTEVLDTESDTPALDYLRGILGDALFEKTEQEAIAAIVRSHFWQRVGNRELNNGLISDNEWANYWKKQEEQCSRKDITALEYLQMIFSNYCADEKTALNLLIESHSIQREENIRRHEDFAKSPEGNQWTKIVKNMSFQECLEFFDKLAGK